MKKVTKLEMMDLLLDPCFDMNVAKQMVGKGKEKDINAIKNKIDLSFKIYGDHRKDVPDITDEQYNAFLASVDTYYTKEIKKLKSSEKIEAIVNRRTHSRKVASLCNALAVAEDIEKNMHKILYMAGYIHDMGKLIDDSTHAKISAEMAYKIAKKLKFHDLYCIALYAIIHTHSNKSNICIKDMNLYQMILVQADLLSKIDISELVLMYDRTKDLEWNRNYLYERYVKKVVQRAYVFNTSFSNYLYNEKLSQYRMLMDSIKY